MEERTEEQKIYQDGIKVVLGGKEYEVRPLKLRAEREWRQKLSKLIGLLPKYAKVTTDAPEEFGGAIDAIMVGMPDQVVDLFFDYAKGLDRAAIEEEATGAEVAEGFKKVMALAFPLAVALTDAMTRLSP